MFGSGRAREGVVIGMITAAAFTLYWRGTTNAVKLVQDLQCLQDLLCPMVQWKGFVQVLTTM